MVGKERYQQYLKEIFEGYGIKGICGRIAKKHKFLFKIYLRLTNISVKKLRAIKNITYDDIKILDIGCGTGSTLFYIHEFINKTADFYGVDLEKNPCLPEFVKIEKCDIDEQNLPFEDEFFDIVISNFVIEHLRKPQRLFDEAKRVLKKDGFFYCSTEYYTSLFVPDYWNFFSDPTHVRPWTKRSFHTLAKITGFEIKKIGIIRWWEFLPLLPFFPFLNLISKSNFSFIPYEIPGRTVYIIAKKP